MALARKIGLKGLLFHDLRHAMQRLLRQVVPVKVVSARLRHINAIVILNTYALVLAGHDERAVEVMEKRLLTAIAKCEATRAN